jgi:hypothetical protein
MFCNKCGAKNPDGSAFCSTCGAKIYSLSKEYALDMSQQACTGQRFTVTIYREKQFVVIDPPIDCLIDGKDNYFIDGGQTVKIDLQEGKHSIALKRSVYRKNLEIDLHSDLTIYLKWSRATGAIKAELRRF